MDPSTKPSLGEVPSTSSDEIHNHKQIPQQQAEKVDTTIQHGKPNKPHHGGGQKTSNGNDATASKEKRENISPTAAALLASEEKRLVRKMDLYIIPLVMVLYVFSFLDR